MAGGMSTELRIANGLRPLVAAEAFAVEWKRAFSIRARAR